MRGITFVAAVVIAALATASGVRAQTSASPTAIVEIKLVPLPTFEAADVGSARSDLAKKDLAGLPLPWAILERSETGMYQIDIDGRRVWVLDSTVKVDAKATGSAFAPEAMGMSDKDLAGSRGYGD